MNSTRLPFEDLRAEAVALRRAGKSRREIQQLLGIRSNATLNDVLAGEPPPEWTRRPRAKDDLHARARELRGQGLDYEEIVAELGVSKSSVSLWVRDLPVPERLSYEECRKRAAEGARRYWESERAVRADRRAALAAAAAAEVGELSDRELLIAGAVAYWCEGGKSKPYNRREQITFVNSDPGLIQLFLRFLSVTGVDASKITYRLLIHESADIEAAHLFWLNVTEARPGQFRKPTLKRHNPKTVRKNTGDGYHGCLCIRVLQGSDLYMKIEGWARAAMSGPTSHRASANARPTQADPADDLSSAALNATSGTDRYRGLVTGGANAP